MSLIHRGIHPFQIGVAFIDRNRTESYEWRLDRIVQEALTNVVRHAQATQIDVSIRLVDHRIHLTVQDDGVGIGEAHRAGRPDSHSLKIMHERAEAVGPTSASNPRREASVSIHSDTIGIQ